MTGKSVRAVESSRRSAVDYEAKRRIANFRTQILLPFLYKLCPPIALCYMSNTTAYMHYLINRLVRPG